MDDEGNFVWVKGKVPKRDKAGNDITGDNLAPGGFRRDDGTLSGMAYDLEPLGGDEDTSPQYNDAPEYRHEFASEGNIDHRRLTIPQALLLAVAEGVAEGIKEVIVESSPEIQRWLFDEKFPELKRKLARKRRSVISRNAGTTAKPSQPPSRSLRFELHTPIFRQ